MRVSFSGTKLHKIFVESNKYVEKEYENYIRVNSAFGIKRKRINEWFFLLRLNLVYFILNRSSKKEEKKRSLESIKNGDDCEDLVINGVHLNDGEIFWVSIIVSIYNVEKYIEEAIESVINQTVGLEKIQLILVNDGSTDGSGKLCEFYAGKYPANIIYIEKENGGLSSARNEGLQYATGKYVNFMDPDDTISPNLVYEVLSFFENRYYETDMVCVPLVFFEAEKGMHAKYRKLGKKNRIISLVKEPENFILSAASSFYKRESIKNMRFDEKLMTEEDTKFNLEIVRRTLNIGYVCEKSVQYNYRRRLSGGSHVDIASTGKNIASLLAPICIFDELFDNDAELALYEKELIVYELRSRLKLLDKDKLGDEEYNKLLVLYKKWISRLDLSFISKSRWIDEFNGKMIFASIQGYSFGECCRRGFIYLPERLVCIRDCKVNEHGASLTISFNNFFDSSIEIVLMSSCKDVIHPSISKDFDGPFDINYGKFKQDNTHIRVFEIPYKCEKYDLYFWDKTNYKYVKVIRKANINPRSRVCSGIRGLGPVFKEHCLSVSGTSIYMDEESVKGYDKNSIVSDQFGVDAKKRLYNGNKKYILINDRPEKAGDNGEALFYYIMENADAQIKNCTFYVINKKSADYKYMKYKEHIIDFRSKEHFIKFLNSKLVFSSHNAIDFFYPFEIPEYKYYADLLKYKFVWLQHGVTKNDICNVANSLTTQNDAVIVASEWEAKTFASESYCYDSADRVIKSGFSRFDRLYNAPENLIVIMPTWRANLVGELLPSGHNRPLDSFENSDFYNNYSAFLTNPKFIELLKGYGYKANFVLHSGFSCYEDMFSQIDNEYVSLVKMDDFSYTEAFAKAKLLITDFSSTAFDFAFLEKPIIYFQFDEESFYKTHYKKGTWGYRKDGFGPVVITAEDLLSEIEHIAKNNFKMDDKYLERTRSCFIHKNDKENCKRIMEATQKLFGFDDIIVESDASGIKKITTAYFKSKRTLDEVLDFLKGKVDI